jgi:predicted DNA-binding transcriptional regulator AlpA
VTERTDIHAAPPSASPESALFDEKTLREKMFWSVPEAAFMCRLSTRTVWRLMADPQSGFPEPRKVRGRTLLAAAEVLAFMEGQ